MSQKNYTQSQPKEDLIDIRDLRKYVNITSTRDTPIDEAAFIKEIPWFSMFLKHYPCTKMDHPYGFNFLRCTQYRYLVLHLNNEYIHHIPSILKLVYEAGFGYLSTVQDNVKSDYISTGDYVYESIVLLALGMFHKHLEDPAQKQARMDHLHDLYNQRKTRYRELARKYPFSKEIVIQHCTGPDALLVKKLIYVLLDFEDGLTRKRVIDYIKKFDFDHVKNFTRWNHDMFIREFEMFDTESYMHLLHDVSINFLVNVHKGIDYVISGSSFLSFTWLRLYHYEQQKLAYEKIIQDLQLPQDDFCEEYYGNSDKLDLFSNLHERCISILEYSKQHNEQLIDPYELCAITFETSRKNQLHSLSDYDAYYTYQNYILACMEQLHFHHENFWEEPMDVQVYVLHSIINYVELSIKETQTKELLLINESDDLLDEITDLTQDYANLDAAYRVLEGEKEEAEAQVKVLQDKQAKDMKKAMNQLEREYKEQISNLQKELQQVKKQRDVALGNETELHTLRDFIFSIQSQQEEEEKEVDVSDTLTTYFKEHKTIFIGGHLSLIQKLKERYPMIQISMDRQVISNPGLLDCVEHIFFFTNWLNHTAYRMCMKCIQKEHIPFDYLYGENVTRIEHQIFQAIQKHAK